MPLSHGIGRLPLQAIAACYSLIGTPSVVSYNEGRQANGAATARLHLKQGVRAGTSGDRNVVRGPPAENG